jgi:hypothetical protein
MPNTKANKQDFELDSGLPDDFDAQISSATFGFKAEYRDGKVPLLLLELEGEEIEPTTAAFSIGTDWQITEGGHRVEHVRGKKRFVSTSMIGRLIERVAKQMEVPLWERGFPTEADIWTGLAFHWKREEVNFGKGILEETGGKTTHLMPTDFLPNYATGDTTNNIEPDMEARLIALAKASSDSSAFARTALKMPGVAANTMLINSILDDSGKGFYALHKVQ